MNLKILLTGKNGQVGRELGHYLQRLGEVVALGHADIDLCDTTTVRQLIRRLQPQLIVNAAAYTAVDQAETECDLAHKINAEAPAVLAEEGKKLAAALVHYSTDYVFDGSKDCPYQETDPPSPINAYGKTKLAGEQAIQQIGIPHLILRTSWVYAVRGKNFLLRILRLASENEEVRVVNDQIGAPTWSRAIAAGTAQMLSTAFAMQSETSHLETLGGVYHMTAAGQTTWFGFASAILREGVRALAQSPEVQSATGGRPLIAHTIVPISSHDYPTPARRPANSVLSNDRLLQTFHLRLPDWRTQLRLAMQNADFEDVNRRVRAATF